jgi:hypothetical protein
MEPQDESPIAGIIALVSLEMTSRGSDTAVDISPVIHGVTVATARKRPVRNLVVIRQTGAIHSCRSQTKLR